MAIQPPLIGLVSFYILDFAKFLSLSLDKAHPIVKQTSVGVIAGVLAIVCEALGLPRISGLDELDATTANTIAGATIALAIKAGRQAKDAKVLLTGKR